MIELLPGLFYNNGPPEDAFDDAFISAHAVRVVVSDAAPPQATRAATLVVELRCGSDVLGVLDAVDKAALIHRSLNNVALSLGAVQDHAWGVALALMRLLRCADPALLVEMVQLNFGDAGLRPSAAVLERLTTYLQHDVGLARRIAAGL